MSWGSTRRRRQAKPRRSAPKWGRPHHSESDRNFVLWSGIASRYLAASSSSLLVIFDDKAKPLRERRCVSSAYTEMHYAFASFFLFRPNCHNALLLAPRVRGARSHSRDTPHLNSACTVSKSARKPFVIKIEKQPAPVALKGRTRWHDVAYGSRAEIGAFKNASHEATIWLLKELLISKRLPNSPCVIQAGAH